MSKINKCMVRLTSGGTPGWFNAIPRHAPIPADTIIKTENENKICFHSGLVSIGSSCIIGDPSDKKQSQ